MNKDDQHYTMLLNVNTYITFRKRRISAVKLLIYITSTHVITINKLIHLIKPTRDITILNYNFVSNFIRCGDISQGKVADIIIYSQ